MLGSIITSKTRLKLLIKFFVFATNTGYLRGIAEEFNESTNAIRKELNQLSEAAYLLKTQKNNKVIYYANPDHPLFSVIQQLVQRYLGLEDLALQVLERAGQVKQVALLGDYARGIAAEQIEFSIIGENLDTAYLLQLADKTAVLLQKRITLHFEKAAENVSRIVLYDFANERI